MSWIEATAAGFGFLCVLLTIRQNIWCWPTGLVQVALYIFVFYEARLYSDVILHVIYVGMQFYGWYHWLHGGSCREEVLVTRLSPRQVAAWIGVVACGTAAWGYTMATFTDAAVPYADAFVVVASLVAQWQMARKNLESWLFWVAVDAAAIAIYFYKSLYFTFVLYAAFLGLAFVGYLAWRKSLHEQSALTGDVEIGDDENGIDAREVCAPAPGSSTRD